MHEEPLPAEAPGGEPVEVPRVDREEARDGDGARGDGGREDIGDAEDGRARWQRRYDEARKRDADFTTLSGVPVDPVYGPPAGSRYPGFDRIGWPGEYPGTVGA